MQTNPNAPTFATGVYDDSCPPRDLIGAVGLSKRETFALVALHGLLTATHPDDITAEDVAGIGQAAVAYADDLIDALNLGKS